MTSSSIGPLVGFPNITAEEIRTFNEFIIHHMANFAKLPSASLHHYTSGENLINIIGSGTIWSTHIACLNDTKEFLYSVDELSARVAIWQKNNSGSDVTILFQLLAKALSAPNIEAAPVFVACFSERGDDLSQWRSYSGGEGGYAISFSPSELRAQSKNRNGFLVRVEYAPEKQGILFDDAVVWAERFYRDWSVKKDLFGEEQWTREFVAFFTSMISFFAPCMKHPAFSSEQEWRLIYPIEADDKPRMLFRQRKSMMSRHLPIQFIDSRLPIDGIMVGPTRYPELSKIAVGDILVASGYDVEEIKVTKSQVPFRTC